MPRLPVSASSGRPSGIVEGDQIADAEDQARQDRRQHGDQTESRSPGRPDPFLDVGEADGEPRLKIITPMNLPRSQTPRRL
jgi:hypothetical protein